MRSVLLILFFVCLLVAQELKYHTSVGYYYDSNVAQNITEYSKSYVVPKLGATYIFASVPLFITSNLAYDFYIAEWDIDESSPFVEAQLGAKIGENSFRYIPTFSYGLFLVNHVFVPNSETELFGQPLFQTFDITQKIRIKKSKNEYSLSVAGVYYDFGDIIIDSVRKSYNKQGLYGTVAIKYKYK